MPIYDYACRECGHVVEVMHGVNDVGPTRCQRCGGPMRKLLSSPAIVFKGSGWAKKDRAPRKTGAAKGATQSETDHRPAAAAESSAGSQSEGDSKPAQSGDAAGAKSKSSSPPASD